MAPLSRVIFEAADGTDRLTVLCAGCLADVQARMNDSNMRYKVRDFGHGSGMCEFCQHEILEEAGAL